MTGTTLIITAAVLAVMNITSFTLMAADKKKAQKGERRIPEKTLFLFTALYGGLGGTLGMIIMRHKTKHWYFALFFPLMALIQTASLIYFYILFA